MIYALVIEGRNNTQNPVLYCHASSEESARNSDAFKEFFKILDRNQTAIRVKILRASEYYSTEVAGSEELNLRRQMIDQASKYESFEAWVSHCADVVESTGYSGEVNWSECQNLIGFKVATGPGWKITQKLCIAHSQK